MLFVQQLLSNDCELFYSSTTNKIICLVLKIAWIASWKGVGGGGLKCWGAGGEGGEDGYCEGDPYCEQLERFAVMNFDDICAGQIDKR